MQGWQARLSLEFSGRTDHTILSARRHRGPLMVQKPFYPEGEVCHVYLLHPPGGVAGGDDLGIELQLHAGAHALVTTPASGKFYRAQAAPSLCEQTFKVKAGATLEWLPQDNILFDGCKVELQTRVVLEEGAHFLGWEILCLGRTAGDQPLHDGYCNQKLEVWKNNRPVFIERGSYAGGHALLQSPWGLAGYTVAGSFVVVGANRKMLETINDKVRERYEGIDGMFSATLLDDVLVCRYLGLQAESARNAFTRAWEIVRPMFLNREACIPRIWKT